MNSLEKIIQSLPEIYQPIYGHPEFSRESSRDQNRLPEIIAIFTALEKALGRPPKVLDLGCAQGFFSLSLAELGAEVVGVDYLAQNIDLCSALAREYRSFRVNFINETIQNFVAKVQPGDFELILGLSVFHHVTHAEGLAYTQKTLHNLVAGAKLGIFEFAKNSEPLYWAQSQPHDPLENLHSVPFSHKVGEYSTHLSSVKRPMYVTSFSYWFIDGKMVEFNEYKDKSNEFIKSHHRGTRRYFLSNDTILKQYYIGNEHLSQINAAELEHEIDFLTKYRKIFKGSEIQSFGNNSEHIWIVRRKIPGRVLMDAISGGDISVNRSAIIRDIAVQLAALEREGLYHNDLRTWNIILSDDGNAHLIDYGSISNKPIDCVWPSDAFLAFLSLCAEILNWEVGSDTPLRPSWFDPSRLPEPFKSAASNLLTSSSPTGAFAKFSSDITDGVENSGVNTPAFLPVLLEATASLHDFTMNLSSEYETLQDRYRQIVTSHEAITELMTTISQERDALRQQALQSQANLASVTSEARHLKDHIEMIRRSFSWRVTAPYRILSKAFKRGLRLAKTLPRTLVTLARSRSGNAFLALVKFIQGNPRAYKLALRLLNSSPFLRKVSYRILLLSRGQANVRKQTILTASDKAPKIDVSKEEFATLSRVGRIKARQILTR